MKIIVCDSYEEMSEYAARIVAEQIKNNPKSVLGLATGSTPVGLYTRLAEKNQSGELDFSMVTTFNLDEYYPIKNSDSQSYRYFMNKNLFDKINIHKSSTFVPDGEADDPVEQCKAYDEMIERAGGIDLQVLGIGNNGHIGFNEPDVRLDSATHLTNLTLSTIQANSRFFSSVDEVPTQALTMGMGSILKARKIIMLASGRDKAEAVAEVLSGKINTSVPATLLNVHSDVTFICDREAYSEMGMAD